MDATKISLAVKTFRTEETSPLVTVVFILFFPLLSLGRPAAAQIDGGGRAERFQSDCHSLCQSHWQFAASALV